MPMSNHAAREGHAILRTVLIALSIVVLLVCLAMWWVTGYGSSGPMARAHVVTVPQADVSDDASSG